LSAGRFHDHPPVKGLNGEECCGSGAHSMKGMSGNQAFCTIRGLVAKQEISYAR
jgi:hypothetical protein